MEKEIRKEMEKKRKERGHSMTFSSPNPSEYIHIKWRERANRAMRKRGGKGTVS